MPCERVSQDEAIARRISYHGSVVDEQEGVLRDASSSCASGGTVRLILALSKPLLWLKMTRWALNTCTSTSPLLVTPEEAEEACISPECHCATINGQSCPRTLSWSP